MGTHNTSQEKSPSKITQAQVEELLARHTPEPWRIESGLSEHCASIDIFGGNDLWIGAIHGDHIADGEKHSGFPSNEEAMANAELIIQAPQMKTEIARLRQNNADLVAALERFMAMPLDGLTQPDDSHRKAIMAGGTAIANARKKS